MLPCGGAGQEGLPEWKVQHPVLCILTTQEGSFLCLPRNHAVCISLTFVVSIVQHEVISVLTKYVQEDVFVSCDARTLPWLHCLVRQLPRSTELNDSNATCNNQCAGDLCTTE